MAVRRGDLQTPSAGPLEDRAVTAEALTDRAAPSAPAPAVALAAALAALEPRLAAARALTPHGRDRHCTECWTRGRDAALRALTEGPA